jgi:hypothetical protein
MPTYGREIPGIAETLAAGSGLEVIFADEVEQATRGNSSAGMDVRLIKRIAMNHAAFRTLPCNDGYFLVERNSRVRFGLAHKIVPLLVKGHRTASSALLRLTFPNAEFLEPVSFDHADGSPSQSSNNVNRLVEDVFWGSLGETNTIFAAVDHECLHWGSALDLDLLFRLYGHVLLTCLPSSYLSPRAGLNLLTNYRSELLAQQD